MPTLDVESSVRERYTQAAQQREAALCCPVDYDARYLKVIPQEVIDRDYGCGDPSRSVAEGETVLDLGSGGGKICFIASQAVGPTGRVIGVDMNDEMLALARRSAPVVAAAVGYDNVTFHKGKIQDLAVDRDEVARYLATHPVTDEASLRDLESFLAVMRRDRPMIADESIDVVVSNCVLNLVDSDDRELLFEELFRVVRPGGRAVISDIVSDVEVPQPLREDAKLWSGCLSGAFELEAFLEAFEQAGFVDVTLTSLQSQPWQVVEGIAFRSATVTAYRPSNLEESPANGGEGTEAGNANETAERIYRGPFKYAVDDDGVMFTRGQVCRDEIATAAARASLADHFVVQTDASVSADGSLPTGDRPAAALPLAGGCCGDDGCC